MMFSVFLGQFLGIGLVITCLALAFHQKSYENAFYEVMESPALWIITSSLIFFSGLLLVFIHNLWVKDWRVLITLFGWFLLLSGAIRLCLQNSCIRFCKKALQKKLPQRLFWVGILVGIFLIYASLYISI